MGPFTHYRFAARFLTIYQPQDASAYFFGALAPDIRYIAGLARGQTHIDRASVRQMFLRYPEQRSFLQGYQLHCLLDEINLATAVGRGFLFAVLRRLRGAPLSIPQAMVLVELDALHKPPLPTRIQGAINPILSGLGVSEDAVQEFACAMQNYIDNPVLENALATFRRIKMVDGTRLEKYLAAYQTLPFAGVLRPLLVWGVHGARLDAFVDRYVQAALAG